MDTKTAEPAVTSAAEPAAEPAPVTVTVIPAQVRTYAIAKELAQTALAMEGHSDEAVAWRHHALALAGLAERALIRRMRADRTPEGRQRMREAAAKVMERRAAAKASGQKDPAPAEPATGDTQAAPKA